MKSTHLSLIILAVLFILASYLAQSNFYYFETVIGDSEIGMLLYVGIAIFSTVVAPVSSLPLLPIAVELWGPNIAGTLSFVGWFMGAGIVFELSRFFGKDLIPRFLNIKSIEKYSEKITAKESFIGLVLLRMSLAVDILSYALGLFTSIKRPLYYSSTAVGILPFAFIWSYFGTIDYQYQIIILSFSLILIYLYFRKLSRNKFTN